MLARTISARDLSLALAAFQIPFFTAGLLVFDIPAVPATYWAPALGSIGFNLVGNVLFIRSLQLTPYSLAMPFLAFSPVFSALTAWVLVGQALTILSFAGMICVVVGALWMKADGKRWDTPLRALFQNRGVLSMLTTALCWSACAAFDKKAADTIPGLEGIAWHLWLLTVGIALGYGLVSVKSPPDMRAILRHLPLLLLVSAAFVAGLSAQMGAFLFIPVAVVETIKRAGSLGASVLVGAYFFREKDALKRLPAVLLMALGVAATVLGW